MAFVPMLMHAQAISLPSDTINCGQVVFKHPVKAEFKMKNSGDKPLLISDVKTSCGCTTVSYPKDAIAPGKTFSVSAVYDAKQLGHFQKEVGIYSNTSDEPLLLTLKGVVVAKKSNFKGEYPYTLGDLLTDKNEILFDDVNRGDMPIQQVHILNNSDQTMEPQLMHLPPYLRGDVKPARLAPGRSATVTLQVDSKQITDLGLKQTQIYLGSFPGDKVSPEKQLDINIILIPSFGKQTKEQLAAAPRLQLSKGRINIGSFEGKAKKKDELEITNIGKSTLSIRSLQIIGTGLEVSLNNQQIEAGESAKLKVTAFRDLIEKSRTVPKVLLITNDPTQPKVLINVDLK
jgi:hypothetical protein